jgi:hypothetical protein
MSQTFTEEEKEINKNSIFIENSKYYNNDELIKYHLTVKNNLMEYCCNAEKCPTKKGNWRRKKMYLILERKNCKKNDLRVSNLRLICPNCYCQEKGPDNFSEYKKKIERKCKFCNYILSNKTKNNICYVCNAKMQKMSVSFNSKEYASLVNSIHDTSGNTSAAYVNEYSSIIDSSLNNKCINSQIKPNFSTKSIKTISSKSINKSINSNIRTTIKLNLDLDDKLISELDNL